MTAGRILIVGSAVATIAASMVIAPVVARAVTGSYYPSGYLPLLAIAQLLPITWWWKSVVRDSSAEASARTIWRARVIFDLLAVEAVFYYFAIGVEVHASKIRGAYEAGASTGGMGVIVVPVLCWLAGVVVDRIVVRIGDTRQSRAVS
jgi:hypothetical protein